MMVTLKEPRSKPPKRERIRAHIEDLKRLIAGRYPDVRFDVGPVPDISWPGLYVYLHLDEEAEEDLRDLISRIQDEFLEQEWMTVFVFVREPNGYGR